jgi:hypothetical protein
MLHHPEEGSIHEKVIILCWLNSEPPATEGTYSIHSTTAAAAAIAAAATGAVCSKISGCNASMGSKLIPDINHETWTLIMVFRLLSLITLIRVIRVITSLGWGGFQIWPF